MLAVASSLFVFYLFRTIAAHRPPLLAYGTVPRLVTRTASTPARLPAPSSQPAAACWFIPPLFLGRGRLFPFGSARVRCVFFFHFFIFVLKFCTFVI